MVSIILNYFISLLLSISVVNRTRVEFARNIQCMTSLSGSLSIKALRGSNSNINPLIPSPLIISSIVHYWIVESSNITALHYTQGTPVLILGYGDLWLQRLLTRDVEIECVYFIGSIKVIPAARSEIKKDCSVKWSAMFTDHVFIVELDRIYGKLTETKKRKGRRMKK